MLIHFMAMTNILNNIKAFIYILPVKAVKALKADTLYKNILQIEEGNKNVLRHNKNI